MLTLNIADAAAENALLTGKESGRNPPEYPDEAMPVTAETGSLPSGADVELMSAVLAHGNMLLAYDLVRRNKGAPGVDGMTVEILKPYLKVHWPAIKQQLLGGRYRPRPVRKVEIPKSSGGVRTLGIPGVLDRLIQLALNQILSPVFEPTFSKHSYGFRPGRSAAQAVRQARADMEEGRRWVVDIGLKQFVDRVNHDILLSLVALRVKGKRVLKLIRAHLQAGILDDGIVTVRGGRHAARRPLSPLLPKILLTDLDRELERRGHCYCRYADDCNVYIHSRRAAERVLASLARFLDARLRLGLNRAKSAIDRPWKRSFLGYTVHRRQRNIRLNVADKPLKRLKRLNNTSKREFRGRKIYRTVEILSRSFRAG